MNKGSKLTVFCGIVLLILTIVNGYTADDINPSLQRSQILAVFGSISLILIGLLWDEFKSSEQKSDIKDCKQILKIKSGISSDLRSELEWGSLLFLTATPAATVVILLENDVILRRGYSNISETDFTPGDITQGVIKSGKMLSLVNTRFLPGKEEFDTILENLPSIILHPISKNGVLILGGLKERCFSLSDEKWVSGWCKKVSGLIDTRI